MLKGFLKLSWIEMKVFLREPMGVIASLLLPVVLFVIVARALRFSSGGSGIPVSRLPFNITILTSMLIVIGAVLSLVAIMAIYREGGILKRLRATPLRPHTILAAHVLVKLLFAAITVTAMLLAGRSYYPANASVPFASFGLAVVFTTASVLSLGFLVASVVPTARFAQPFGAIVFYPMLAVSGLFMPVETLPPG